MNHRIIEAAPAPTRFARGWHCLGLAKDFKDGKPHLVEAFGTKIVVFQGESGALSAINAYCPHMGADLSRGRVEGDSLACPFHDWRWNGEGKCTAIPYAEPPVGPLRFRHVPGARIRTDLTSLPITAEQSNTSLLFGDAYICKLFRRLGDGVNLDLEVNLALTRAGCEHVPAVHGWIELAPGGDGTGGQPVTLGLLSDYLRTGADGWSLAIASVRDWFAHTTEPARVGGVTGLVGAAGGLGGFVPPLLMGWLYGQTDSYAIGLWLLAATAALTLALTLLVVRRTAAAATATPVAA